MNNYKVILKRNKNGIRERVNSSSLSELTVEVYCIVNLTNNMTSFEQGKDGTWINNEVAFEEESIRQGKICPYCGEKSEIIESKELYGKDYGKMYICKPCDAYVGTHKIYSIPVALGRLANKELREAKKLAHGFFDQLWKTQKGIAKMTDWFNQLEDKPVKFHSFRQRAYLWLSKVMDKPLSHTHIGMFDMEECDYVIRNVKYFLNKKNGSINN